MKLNGRDHTVTPVIESAYKEWANWVQKNPVPNLDWRDRFYIEQRVAGWLSAIEQSLDLTGSERFYMANCHHILSLFISIPDEKRRTFQLYNDLIETLHPVLLKFPFNPKNSPFQNLKSKLVKFFHLPFKAQYKKIKEKF